MTLLWLIFTMMIAKQWFPSSSSSPQCCNVNKDLLPLYACMYVLIRLIYVLNWFIHHLCIMHMYSWIPILAWFITHYHLWKFCCSNCLKCGQWELLKAGSSSFSFSSGSYTIVEISPNYFCLLLFITIGLFILLHVYKQCHHTNSYAHLLCTCKFQDRAKCQTSGS